MEWIYPKILKNWVLIKEFGMALKETIGALHQLIVSIMKDLVKVGRGNKAAAQRVRVGTIQLERVAKVFRKESVAAEKGGKPKKKAPRKTKRKLYRS